MAPQKSNMPMFSGHQKLDDESLKKVFMMQLDNIFCIKKHLVDYLPTLIDKASFTNLKYAIEENIEDIGTQLQQMETMYSILNAEFTNNPCISIKPVILEAYQNDPDIELSPLEVDLSLLIHLRTIEGIEVTCFNVLRDLARNMASKDLSILLRQNLDIALDSKRLYDMITKQYIN